MNIPLTILWGATSSQENFAMATLIDVSPQGAKFRVSAQMPRGSCVIFNIHTLGISGRGTVRYCSATKGQYEIGVEVSNGTGWRLTSKDVSEDLRRLGAAIQPAPSVGVPEESEIASDATQDNGPLKSASSEESVGH